MRQTRLPLRSALFHADNDRRIFFVADRIDRRLSRLNDLGCRNDLNPLLRVRIFLQFFFDDIHLADQLDFDTFICVYGLNGAFTGSTGA